MSNGRLTPLPVGFDCFHWRAFFSYQLTRAHALG